MIDAIDSVRPKAALILIVGAIKSHWSQPVARVGRLPDADSGYRSGENDSGPAGGELRERLKSDFGIVKNSKGKLAWIACSLPKHWCTRSQTVRWCYESHGGRAEADGLCIWIWPATMVTATFGFVAVSHALKK